MVTRTKPKPAVKKPRPPQPDVFQAHWIAAQRYIYDKRTQAKITEENPRAFPSAPPGFKELWPHLAPITPMDPWRAAGLARRLYEVRHVPGDVIECGVFMGAMSVMMALLSRQWGTPKHIHMHDSFRGLPPPDRKIDRFYEAGWFAANRAAVETVIEKAGVREQVTLRAGWFHETLPTLTDERFCLAHLDGDLYSSTIDCLTHLIPRVSNGGVVVADDYFDEGTGVKQAVDEHLTRTGEELCAGPVTQAFFRPGVLAKDRNRKGVRASVTELKGDTAYVAAVRTVSGWLQRDAVAGRRMATHLGGRAR